MTVAKLYQQPTIVATQQEPSARLYQQAVIVATQQNPDARLYQMVMIVAVQVRTANPTIMCITNT